MKHRKHFKIIALCCIRIIVFAYVLVFVRDVVVVDEPLIAERLGSEDLV